MAVTGFSPVSWQPNEIISNDKLDQMSSNDQFLFDNMPKVSYRAHGIARDKSMKILAGMAFIPPSKASSETVQTYFNNYFSAGCWPIVTTGTVSNAFQRCFVMIHGFGVNHPDNRGFAIQVSMDALVQHNNYIKRGFFISWIAVGY